jgi:hypothetical protein
MSNAYSQKQNIHQNHFAQIRVLAQMKLAKPNKNGKRD